MEREPVDVDAEGRPGAAPPADARWVRNTVQFLTGQTISVFGSSLVQYAILWHLTLETKSGLVLTPAFGEEVWMLTANEVVFSIGMILGGALLAAWGSGRDRMELLTGATIAMGILTVALGLSSVLWLFLGLMFLVGVVVPAFSTTSATLLQQTVEPEMQGRMFGLLGIVMALAMPIGMAAFGPLADVVSVEMLLIAGGALTVAAGLIIRSAAPALGSSDAVAEGVDRPL